MSQPLIDQWERRALDAEAHLQDANRTNERQAERFCALKADWEAEYQSLTNTIAQLRAENDQLRAALAASHESVLVSDERNDDGD